ncbi:MAG: beta strand repeat-containing protein, partial [Phycisphaerae bacterium]
MMAHSGRIFGRLLSSSRKNNLLMLAVAPAAALALGAPALAATDSWTGATSANWGDAGNWTGGNPIPQNYDSLLFSTPANPANDNNANNLSGLILDGITFDAAANAYTLNGNPLTLSGNYSAVSTGILNASASNQTVNNNLSLDWGGYLFGTSAGTTLNLNGTFTTGNGVALFQGGAATGTINVPALAVDPNTHLIAGIGGHAMMVNASNRPTGLATISNGTITAYTFSDADAQNITVPGPIASNVNSNVLLTGAATPLTTLATDATVTNTTYLNTITTAAVTAAGANITIAGGNYLVLGKQGGIYAPAGGGTGTTKNLITIAGDGTISAGGNTAGNGDLIFSAGGGNNSGNQIYIRNTGGISDNPLGGTVTVFIQGTGSMVFNTTSSYTGGTYVGQGSFLQGNAQVVGPNVTTPFGTGPVYIASGATVFPNLNGKDISGGLVIFANDFYLSPGLGYSGNLGNMKTGNENFTGKMTLQGAPSSTLAPGTGDRIAESISGGTTQLSGQITGTGTLELNAETGTANFLLNNATPNANNWTGGLIVDGANNDSTTVQLGAPNQLNNNNVNLVQTGSGASILDIHGFDDSIGALNGTGTANAVSNYGGSANLTLGANNANGSFPGNVTGPIALIKNGTGTQTLGGFNAYTGDTTINAGTLVLSGFPSGNVTINSGAVLAGNASIGGAVTVSAGAHLSPGAGTAVGTISVGGGGLNVAGDLDIKLTTPGASDFISVSGPVTFSGSPTLTLNGGSVGNTYTILSANAPITYTATPTLASASTLTRPTVYSLDTTSNPAQLAVTVLSGGSANLTWNGSNGTAWNINSTKNWTNAATSSSDVFYNLDSVTLGDGPANRNISISGTVQPAAVTVNNSAGNDYTLSGGAIGGTANITKSGAGNLTLANDNTFSGGITLNSGTLNVGNGGTAGSLGTGPVLNNSEIVFNRSDASTHVNAISGSGNVTIAAGTVTLAGASTYSGTTTIAPGAIAVVGYGDNTNADTVFGSAPGGNVSVPAGASLWLNFATANYINFGTKEFDIAGTGADGNGVIVNTGTTNQQNAFQNINLTGDATFGGSARFDIRSGGGALLNLNGHTLTKNGSFQLTLVNATVNPGNIVVNQGTFSMEANTTIADNADGTSITYNDGTTGQFYITAGNANGNLNVSRPININGNVTFGNNNNGNASLASNVTLNGNLTVTAINGNGTGTLAFMGNISETGGPRSITKNANGNGLSTLVLGGTNSFTGGLLINGGIVQLAGANALNPANVVSFGANPIAGSKLQVNGFDTSVAGLTTNATPGSPTVENGGGANATLTINNPANASFAGVLQDGTGGGALALAKNGAGTQTLSGNNTFTGGTAINAGTLVAASLQALGTGNVTLNTGGTLQLAPALPSAFTLPALTFNGGHFDITDNKVIAQDAISHATTLATLQSKAGSAIISSTRPANYGIAVLDNAVLNLTTFGGVNVDANSILVSQELLGDANADGKVDLTDLSTILNHFGLTTPNWTDGNFDGA